METIKNGIKMERKEMLNPNQEHQQSDTQDECKETIITIIMCFFLIKLGHIHNEIVNFCYYNSHFVPIFIICSSIYYTIIFFHFFSMFKLQIFM